jgi:hypothetical protein
MKEGSGMPDYKIERPIRIIRRMEFIEDDEELTPEEAAQRTARKKQPKGETTASVPQAATDEPVPNQIQANESNVNTVADPEK